MGTTALISLIFAGLGTLLHLLPRKSSSSTPATPATPSTPSSTPATPDSSSGSDKFSGWPGLPNHPLLNAIFGDNREVEAAGKLAEMIANSPVAATIVKARLAK